MRAFFPIILVIAFCSCGPRHHVKDIPAAPVTRQPELGHVPDVPQNKPEIAAPAVAPRAEQKTETAPAPSRDLGSILLEAAGSLRDMFFDYDRFELGKDAVAAAEHNADLLAPILAEFRQVQVIVEGHCDERGSAEYNLALGDRRASAAADALRGLGVQPPALQTISYGKEMPQCFDADEACWRRNRRAHLVLRQSPESSGSSSLSLSHATTGTATPSPNR